MANYTTAADLLDDVLWRAGEGATATGDRTSDFATVALTYLNLCYQKVNVGGSELLPDCHEDWWWLWKTPPATVIMTPEYNTGTVNVTNNSTSGAFSSAPAPSLAGWFLKVQGSALGNADIARISTHTAGATAFTLDAVWTGATATAASFDAFKLEYTLGATDIIRLISPMRNYRATDPDYYVYQDDSVAQDASFPLPLIESGTPSRYSIVNIDSSGNVTVRFNRWADANSGYIRLEYDYLFRPADLTDSSLSIPLLPREYRHILSDWALYYLLFDKDETRAMAAQATAKGGLRAMQLENQKRLGSAGRFKMGSINPRPSDWLRSQPLRTQTGLIIG